MLTFGRRMKDRTRTSCKTCGDRKFVLEMCGECLEDQRRRMTQLGG